MNKRISEVINQIKNIAGSEDAGIFYLHCLFKSKINNNITLEKVKKIIKKENLEVYFQINLYISNDEASFRLLRDNLSIDEIQKATEILFSKYDDSHNRREGYFETPDSIVELAKNLLQPNSNESVLEQGSGLGKFQLAYNKVEKNNFLTGIEINNKQYALSVVRSEIAGVKVNFINDDVFNYNGEKFDKVFSNCPFGMRYASLEMSSNLENVAKSINGLRRASSADWVYSINALLNLKETGRAVSVVTGGCLVNIPDTELRKNLLKKGMIETIIALPERLFGGTCIKTYLVVFSNNNSRVNMVNASNLFEKGRRINTISDDKIKYILDAIGKKTEINKTLEYSEIDIETFNLDPVKYTVVEETFENDIELGKCIKSVRRASRVTATELDKLVTSKKTGNKLITMGDIQDSSLSSLKSFTEFPEKSDRFMVNKNDVLITRSANPDFKVAIYEGNDNETAIAVGNLYVITVDENVLNPYYLLAFFNSKLGQTRLSANSAGSTITVLPIEGINNIKIPLISLTEQSEIANKTKNLITEIKSLKKQLSDDVEQLSNVCFGLENN